MEKRKAPHLLSAIIGISAFLFLGFSYALGAYKSKIHLLFEVRGIKENHPFRRPQGIFVHNSQKKIYVADTDNQEIAVFSFSGESLGTLKTDRPLSSPIALSFDAEGRIYISQRGKNALEVFSPKGRFLHTIPSPDCSKSHAFSPGRFALSPDGKVYVVNREKAQVWVFEKDGTFVLSFGGKDSEEGRFQFITDIFFHEGKVYVADAQGIPVQVFTAEGTFQYSLGKHGRKREDFSFPRAVSVDVHHHLWVADAFRHKVNVYDQKGEFLFHLGSFGKTAGAFCFPVDLDFDHENRLYILEKGSDRFQVFSIEEGELAEK